jgi:hypothetical protein
LRERDKGFLKHGVFIQRLKDVGGKIQNPSAGRRLVRKVLWVISISRNSIVVIIGMTLAYILEGTGDLPFKVTGTTSTIFSFLFFYWSQSVLRFIM